MIEDEEHTLGPWDFVHSPADGAGVEHETNDPAEAYTRFASWEQRRPEQRRELPWGKL